MNLIRQVFDPAMVQMEIWPAINFILLHYYVSSLLSHCLVSGVNFSETTRLLPSTRLPYEEMDAVNRDAHSPGGFSSGGEGWKSSVQNR